MALGADYTAGCRSPPLKEADTAREGGKSMRGWKSRPYPVPTLFSGPVHALFRCLFGSRARARVGVGATAGPPQPPLWQRGAELEGRGGRRVPIADKLTAPEKQ